MNNLSWIPLLLLALLVFSMFLFSDKIFIQPLVTTVGFGGFFGGGYGSYGGYGGYPYLAQPTSWPFLRQSIVIPPPFVNLYSYPYPMGGFVL